MKRLLAMLLCLTLLLPVLALGEETDYSAEDLMETEDIEVDENGNIILGDASDSEISFSEEELMELADTIVYGDTVDPSELELNTNLPDEWINILLLGLDTPGTKEKKLLTQQGEFAKRADVQMILSINKEDGSVKLTSIARNTEVDIPDRNSTTLIANSYGHAIYKNGQYAGWVDTPYMCMRTVNRNFEMNIEHYIAINFYGVASIIEALGGVDLELTAKEAKAINTFLSMKTIYKYDSNGEIKRDSSGKKMLASHGKAIANTYDDKNGVRDALEVKDGVQHLDGLQALIYARLREIDNDFVRTSRTRKLLSTLLTPTVTKINNNELDLWDLMNLFIQYFIADPGLNPQRMLEICKYVLNSDIAKTVDATDSMLEEFRIPVDGTWVYANTESGASVNRFKSGQKQANVEMLHEFIYGAYYPAD